MKNRSLFFAAAIALPLFTVSATAKETNREKQIREIFERSPEQLLPLIELSGDSMDPSLKVSSYGVSQIVNKGLIASTTIENSFLRAFIKKSSRAVTIQVYHSAVYSASGWYYLNRATYQDADGLKEVELDRIDSGVACGRYGCTYSEDVAFEISKDTLEKLAAQYDPINKQKVMRYRLFGKSGNVIDEVIPLNEVAAFAIKVRDLTKP